RCSARSPAPGLALGPARQYAGNSPVRKARLRVRPGPAARPLGRRRREHDGLAPRMNNWLTNYVLPKIRAFTRKDVPDNLWKKCPSCEQMLFHRELAANFEVCRSCGHHFRIGAEARFRILFDGGVFELVEVPRTAPDPLRFRDRKRYSERLRE